MEIKDEVSSIIGSLDYKWFIELNRMFTLDSGYGSDKKRIYRVVKGFFTEVDNEGVYHEDDLIISCGIIEYCWEYDFENMRTEGDGAPIEGFRVAMQIEKLIGTYIIGIDKNEHKLEFIKKIVGAVRVYIKGLKEIDTSTEYSSVLDYFVNRLRSRLAGIYKQVINEATSAKEIETFSSYDFSIGLTPDTIIEHDEQKIREILKPLSGKWLGAKIMRQKEFDELVYNVTEFTRAKGDITKLTLRKFSISKAPETFVRYTFYLLSEEKLNGKIRNGLWVEFLKQAFTLFDSVHVKTIYKKYSTKPDNYDADLLNTITYQ